MFADTFGDVIHQLVAFRPVRTPLIVSPNNAYDNQFKK